MPVDAMAQGESTDQDVLGLDLDPVTAPSSEQEGQTESVQPKPEAAKPKAEGKEEGAVPNAEAKEQRIKDKKTKIAADEWQRTQETLAAQAKEIAAMRRENFEAKNPIVTNDRYKAKWEELLAQKNDPEHKYHRLDYTDLRMILIDQETADGNVDALEELETSQRPPLSAPNFGSSNVKSKTPGGVEADTYGVLQQLGYSDAEIEDSKEISLTQMYATRRR